MSDATVKTGVIGINASTLSYNRAELLNLWFVAFHSGWVER